MPSARLAMLGDLGEVEDEALADALHLLGRVRIAAGADARHDLGEFVEQVTGHRGEVVHEVERVLHLVRDAGDQLAERGQLSRPEPGGACAVFSSAKASSARDFAAWSSSSAALRSVDVADRAGDAECPAGRVALAQAADKAPPVAVILPAHPDLAVEIRRLAPQVVDEGVPVERVVVGVDARFQHLRVQVATPVGETHQLLGPFRQVGGSCRDVPVEMTVVGAAHRQGVALLAVAERLLCPLARGDVGVGADQAAVGRCVAPDLEDRAVPARPLVTVRGGAARDLHGPGDNLRRIAGTEVAALGAVSEHVPRSPCPAEPMSRAARAGCGDARCRARSGGRNRTARRRRSCGQGSPGAGPSCAADPLRRPCGR